MTRKRMSESEKKTAEYVPYVTWEELKKLIPISKSHFITMGKQNKAPKAFNEYKFTRNAHSTQRHAWIKSEIDEFLRDPESYKKAEREAEEKEKAEKPDYSYIDLDVKPCKSRLRGC